RRVYAIEASAIGRLARAVFEANGVGDRATLVEGWSSRVSLPERADVAITETLGHEPLAESALEFLLDARSRLLAPDARLIPARIWIAAVPVTIPDDERRRYVLVPETLAEWKAEYGIDFGPLASAALPPAYAVYVDAERTADWRPLGDAVTLLEVDLGA